MRPAVGWRPVCTPPRRREEKSHDKELACYHLGSGPGCCQRLVIPRNGRGRLGAAWRLGLGRTRHRPCRRGPRRRRALESLLWLSVRWLSVRISLLRGLCSRILRISELLRRG